MHIVLMPLPTTKPAIEAQLNGNLVINHSGDKGYVDEYGKFIQVTYHSLASIMHYIKRHTANECNKLLGRSGAFWEAENYDRYVRSEDHWKSMINYTLNNPVKARIVEEWSQYRWNWLRTG
jgi:hypothetical protein